MALVGVRQFPPPLHGGEVHLVRRQLKALLEHGGDQVEIPGGQHRADFFPHQFLNGGEDCVGQGVAQGEDARQLPIDGAEHGVFHVQPHGEGDLHQVHKGRRAHQHLVAPDVGGQAAPLVAVEVVGVAHQAAQGS